MNIELLFSKLYSHLGIKHFSCNLKGGDAVYSTLLENKKYHPVPYNEILNHLCRAIPLCKDKNIIKTIGTFLGEVSTVDVEPIYFTNLLTTIYWVIIRTLLREKEVINAYSCAIRLLKLNPSPSNHLKFFQLFKNFSKDIIDGRKIKIALLSNSSTHHLQTFIQTKCWELGILPETRSWNFTLAEESILKSDSHLYQFCPNLIIVAFDNEFVRQPSLDNLVKGTNPREWNDLIQENTDKIFQIVLLLRQYSNALIVVHNFPQSPYTSLGILDTQINIGNSNFWRMLNIKIVEKLCSLSQVKILDLDNCVRRWGWEKILDERFVYYAKTQFGLVGYLYLAGEYLRYIKPLLGLNKKCIVVDLDNTLWGGVVGEDGIPNLEIGETPLGLAYINFQKAIKSFRYRGIFLAVISKNNFEDAIGVFRQHPRMVLNEKDFVAIKINWKEKWQNMKEISQEVNIGTDAMVFLDDSPAERASMRYNLPEVLTPDLPPDPVNYTKTLFELNDLEVLSLTDEDRLRTEYYQTEQQRKHLHKTCSNLNEYLIQLGLVVKIFSPNSFIIPRITQLINRTNQFNMTTRRYTQAEIEGLLNKNYFEFYPATVSDKYGDSGITAFAIVLKNEYQWIIDNLLLSCRILGRGVEQAILSIIIQDAIKADVQKLSGLFVPTGKNTPAKDFYSKSGFQFLGKNEKGEESWILEVQKVDFHCPAYIRLIDERVNNLVTEKESNYVAKTTL